MLRAVNTIVNRAANGLTAFAAAFRLVACFLEADAFLDFGIVN